ncbi:MULTISPECIES: NAD(P)/FAD-dependent oxidoreductase [Paraburkholderia]|uniref:FAD-binding oxidoreductase n=1 Tax=Paraburkholderia metrosideri TaxID=580937 RepID=A0ABW9E4G3_9BURK
MTPIGCDFLVIGGGIAGASVAYWLAPHGRTIVLERESQPGYHATGRSAAQYIATYGTPQVRTLTLASREFFDYPPEGFGDAPLLRRRSVLTIGLPGHETLLDEAWQVLCSVTDSGERLDAATACAMVPVLRRERIVGAILEPESYDMEVHALHQGFLRGLKHHGARLVNDADVIALVQRGSRWLVQTTGVAYEAPIVVNAAGAWCDVVARQAGVQPIGIVPRRRSAFTFEPPSNVAVRDWPLVGAADHSFYFKPDAGVLLGSPANADPAEPQDVQPEELDIALGIHLLEENTTLRVRPQHTWAGLRSFVADGDLVAGFDPVAPGFFWCAGQGGYGIQTSAAMGEACAALVRGEPLPPHLLHFGLTPAMLSPNRLRTAA